MTKDPAVLFYTSDFLSGTSFFTMEQRGQYITLLCQQHQLGDIPENHMINICSSLDSPVINKFIKNEQGNYYNQRMKDEAEKRKAFCSSRSNNKSGRKKKEKKEITSKSYENHISIHMENENDNTIKDIIDYLNNVLGTHYKYSSVNTRKLIKARLKDFTLDDFKVVIDKKYNEWKDTDMSKHLVPETLFGNKFEGYLNQQINKTLTKGEKNAREADQFIGSIREAITSNESSMFELPSGF